MLCSAALSPPRPLFAVVDAVSEDVLRPNTAARPYGRHLPATPASSRLTNVRVTSAWLTHGNGFSLFAFESAAAARSRPDFVPPGRPLWLPGRGISSERGLARMAKRVWTEERLTELRSFIEAGGSPARAVARFKCTEVALRTKAHELGLSFPSLKERRLRATGSAQFSDAAHRPRLRWKEV